MEATLPVAILTLFALLPTSEALQVLFIGNSYTFRNDVPKLVQSLAEAADLELIYDQHTESGWSLERHWNSQTTIDKIKQGNWDVVILQGHSQETSGPEAQICEKSFPFAKNLANLVHEANPKAVIQWYLSWGRPFGDGDRCQDIPEVCSFEGNI